MSTAKRDEMRQEAEGMLDVLSCSSLHGERELFISAFDYCEYLPQAHFTQISCDKSHTRVVSNKTGERPTA